MSLELIPTFGDAGQSVLGVIYRSKLTYVKYDIDLRAENHLTCCPSAVCRFPV
jgi:hypothetical protein